VIALLIEIVSSSAAAQTPSANLAVEEIAILRSLRLSRNAPTEFCARSRTAGELSDHEPRFF
jgi:hypothetical protein